MKKRVLSVMMAVCMMTMVITGCGQKNDVAGDDVNISAEETKEEAEEETDEADTEESVEESVEASSEEIVEESEEENIAESAEEEIVEESTEEETTAESNEKVPVIIDDTDLTSAYEGYMEREGIISENVKMTASTTAENMTFEVEVATCGDFMMMRYDFGSASFKMYATKEKVYACTYLQGTESWMWAPVASQEEADEIVDMADTNMFETENVQSYSYRETVEEDGVIYDLLDAAIDEDETNGIVTYYVNRETQKIEKITMDQDGTTVVCLLEEIDSIEIPAEAENAEEGTTDDIMGNMLAVIFAAAGEAMQ